MKSLKFISFLSCAVAIIFISCTKTHNSAILENQLIKVPDIGAPILEPKFKVIAYVPEWAIDLKKIQFDKVTHINYAFILPTSKGGLSPISNTIALKELIATAHLKNVKVLASIGGWNYGDASAFISLAANAAYRENFVHQLLELIRVYGFDGIDIDWETPKVGVTDQHFTTLIKQLSIAIHQKNKLLSIAVPPLNELGIENEVFNHIDFLNIMAYDSFIDDKNHSPYSLAVSSLAYWKGRGLPAHKAILGVPFYGRTKKNYDFTSYVLFNEIISRGGNVNEDSLNGLAYNGIATIIKKTELAMTEGGGIMIWELSGDAPGTNSLLTSIANVIAAKN